MCSEFSVEVLRSSDSPTAAAEVWHTQFDEAVYGDVAVVGNAVLTCPTPEQAGPDPKYLPQSCVDGLNRKGHGPSAQNNGHRMMWADVDDDPQTFNSSSARLDIQAGAAIAYAKLGWAGNATCRDATAPPGGAQDAVTFNGTRVTPGRFVRDSPDDLSPADNAFYSAEADVTRLLQGTTVTVGNVWTPQGFDCFGGWSLTVVWKFAGPTATTPARRHVSVHGGHVRLPTELPALKTRSRPRTPRAASPGWASPPTRATGPPTAI